MDKSVHPVGGHNFQVASRHMTSEGLVVYTRCECGELEMNLVPWDMSSRPLTTHSAA